MGVRVEIICWSDTVQISAKSSHH